MSLEKLRTARTVAGMFIAADVDDRVLGPLLAACREKGIVPERMVTKAELGERARLDVSAAAVATLR